MKRTIRKLCTQARVALLAGTIIVAGSSLAFNRETHANEKAAPLKLVVNDQPLKREDKPGTSFAPVVKKVAPSVVKVFTTASMKNVQHPMMDDPFFRRFFGPGRGEEMPERGLRMPKQHGLGSGVIVTKDGYILTNNHVVDGAETVKVALTPDGREHTARVVGKDPKTDIAVLKIEGENLPHIELGDSEQIEVGDLVLAVGNPFGIGQTVTMGMVSATRRNAMGLGLDYEDFIQTDAAINPGNSGGALVDSEGRLIGINTAILSRSGGNQGIGFAVPINLARGVMESIVEHGRVVRGFMGVNIQDVTPDLAREFGLKEPAGALVAEVTAKSPADRAGLQTGDVVVEYNGRPVRDSRHLKLQVGQTAPGEQVAVKLVRDGKPQTVKVTLKEFADDTLQAKSGTGAKSSKERLAGVGVTDIEPEQRRELGLPRDLKGVLVSQVAVDSPAYEAGLRQGDVITEINRQPVIDSERAVELAEKAEDDSILLRIWRQGARRYLVVDESDKG